ncbi:MAG: DUF3990 domain-containing protein [Oscillospiraceae bacterium]|nr:DUF3990 domain-containing protein [Oscillospiraceae bacterium]
MNIFDEMTDITLRHGSDRELQIKDIEFPGPRDDCDFGRGFYLTEVKQVAAEWIFDESTPVINEYKFSFPKNKILFLTNEDWLRIVIGFRERQYQVYFKSPVICGLIADDRMSNVMPQFMNGTIGDKRLIKCLDYCKLGNQYCLRESAEGLIFNRSYKLKGLELQQAAEGFRNRRKGMQEQLIQIQRNSIQGEKFIEDYIRMGDYVEI